MDLTLIAGPPQAGSTSRPCVVVDCGELSSKKDT